MARVLVAIRFPEELKRFIDEESENRGMTMTAFIVNACWCYLEEPRGSSETGDHRKTEDAGSIPAPSSTLDHLRQTIKAIEAKPAEELGMSLPSGATITGVEVRAMCGYTEYDQDTGETYGCSLPAHSPKVKHRRGPTIA